MDIEALEKLLGGPRDDALLRLTLGRALLDAGRVEDALAHLAEAVSRNPDYTAAWKTLGRALQEAGDLDAAAGAYGRGIEVARARGDVQAEKEMGVFLRRLDRARE